MLRTKVQDALKAVSPGLATRDLLPIFSCFCFRDGKVFAYNDVVAVEFPLDVGFEGAVKGSTLLSSVNSSRAKTVEVEPGAGEELVFKIGRARVKLPVIGVDQFAFEFPNGKSKGKKITEDFLLGIERASFAMGTDTSYPERLGITISGSTIYATDNFSVVSVQLEEEWPTMVLPPRFVELLLSNRNRVPTTLQVDDSFVVASFEDGLRVLSKTVHEGNPGAFEELCSILPEEIETFPLPKGFDFALDKALSVLSDDEPHTRFVVSDGKLKMRSSSSAGVVNETSKISPEHPDVDVRTSPVLIRRALKYVSHLRFFADLDLLLLDNEDGTTNVMISLVTEAPEID